MRFAYRALHDTASLLRLSCKARYGFAAVELRLDGVLIAGARLRPTRDFAPGPVIDARIDGALRRKSAAPQAYLRKQIAAANMNTMR